MTDEGTAGQAVRAECKEFKKHCDTQVRDRGKKHLSRPELALSLGLKLRETTLWVCWLMGAAILDQGSQKPSWHLACIHAKSLQSCPTFCDPLDCSPPGFSVCWILQARTLKWVAVSFCREPSWPRDWTCVSYVHLHLQAVSLTLVPCRKPVDVQSNLLTELMGVQRAGDSLDSSYRLAFWDANQVNVAEAGSEKQAL